MRSRLVPFTLLAVVLAGIIFGAIYFQMQKNAGSVPQTTTSVTTTTLAGAPGGSGTPMANATPEASPAPGASPNAMAGAPTPGATDTAGMNSTNQNPIKDKNVSNPNPDLTVDANGLSK